MRLIGAPTDESSIRHYLRGGGLPAVPPPITPTRHPPQTAFEFTAWAFPRKYRPDRAVEPCRLYGPWVAVLRNKATHHAGAHPAPGPHSSVRTRRQAPKISGKTLEILTTTAQTSFLPAIHAQEMAFVVPIRHHIRCKCFRNLGEKRCHMM